MVEPMFWEGYEAELQTLLVDGVVIAVFALLVHTFYKNLSRRNLSAWRAGRPTRPVVVALLFPLISFGFFLIITFSLLFLSKQQTLANVLLIGMGVTAAVRITAYVSESSAEDLAKMIPLGLLAVALVEPGYLTLDSAVTRVQALLKMTDIIAVYFIFLVLLEVVLRVVWLIRGWTRGKFPGVTKFRRAARFIPAATEKGEPGNPPGGREP